LSSIGLRDAADLIETIAGKHGGPSANRAKASFGPYFGWLLSRGRVETNPFAFTPKVNENGSRERVLSNAELAAIWHTAGDDQFGAIVKLLVLTGARRAEIGDLTWDEVAGDMVTIPAARSKNRRDHEIPLSPPAKALLDSRPRRNSTNFVFGQKDGAGFSGWSKSKRELDQRLVASGAITCPWTLHDLRRSTATGLAEQLQVQPHIIEAVLGHAGGFRAGVAGVYNRASYGSEKIEALRRWSDHIRKIVKASEPKRSQRSGSPHTSTKDGQSHGRRSQEIQA
jgi:integrase